LRLSRGVAARHAFVEQQGGAAHRCIAQEAALPDALPSLQVERVAQRHEVMPM